MRARSVIGVSAIVLSSIVGLVVARGKAVARVPETAAPTSEAPAAVTPRKAPPPQVAAPLDLGVGVLLAERATDISPRYEGRLRAVGVRLGDHVDEGAVLAAIDVNVTRFDVPKARAALRSIAVDEQRAQAAAAEQKEKLARTARLVAAGAVREEELATARYAAEEARLRVLGLRAERAARAAEVGRLQQVNAEAEIRAPFAGVIARRYVDPGASVSTVTAIVRLVGDGRRFVRFAVPERAAPTLHIGSRVVAATSTGALPAVVDRIAPEVDGASRTVVVEAALGEGISASLVTGEMVRVHEGAEASP